MPQLLCGFTWGLVAPLPSVEPRGELRMQWIGRARLRAVTSLVPLALLAMALPVGAAPSGQVDGVRQETLEIAGDRAVPEQASERVKFSDGTSAQLQIDAMDGVSRLKLTRSDDGVTTDVVTETADGAQWMLHIPDSRATDSYTFDVDAGPNTRLKVGDDGSVTIFQGGDVVGHVAAPWAVDANGSEVATRYEVRGDTLTQHVDHTGAAYPVVADPWVSFGWNLYVNWSKSEVHRLADDWNFAHGMALAVCGTIPHPAAKAGCALVAATHWWAMKPVWQYADAHNKCVQYIFSYSGNWTGGKWINC